MLKSCIIWAVKHKNKFTKKVYHINTAFVNENSKERKVMDMDYNKYKHPKEIPIHFFGETMQKNNDLFLIFRMLTRRKTRAGPYKIVLFRIN